MKLSLQLIYFQNHKRVLSKFSSSSDSKRFCYLTVKDLYLFTYCLSLRVAVVLDRVALTLFLALDRADAVVLDVEGVRAVLVARDLAWRRAFSSQLELLGVLAFTDDGRGRLLLLSLLALRSELSLDLGATLMVVGEVASLAHAHRVEQSISVTALGRVLVATELAVAGRAHVLGVVLAVRVRTFSDLHRGGSLRGDHGFQHGLLFVDLVL